MDSPYLFQDIDQTQRMRSNSNLSVRSVDHRGAVRKHSSPLLRSRSVSTTQTDRLYHLALHQSNQADISALPPTSIAPQWLTPQHSPQPQLYASQQIEPFPQWTVPTPPRSDSGVPTVSVDANDEPVTTGISSTDFTFEQPTASADMRSARGSLMSRGAMN